MNLGEEILRDKVAQAADPVEWLIQQVLRERRRAIEAERREADAQFRLIWGTPRSVTGEDG